MKKGHGLLTHIVNVLVFVSLFLITANTGFPQLKDMIKKTEQGIKDVGKQTKTNVDAEKLAFEADKELNAAQRDMFSGKKDQAVEGLLKAAQKIADVKSLNPDHPKLNILESKRDKLRGDLEKRVGKKIPLPSDPKDNQTTPAPEKAAPLTPAPAQIKPEASQKENLPHDARVIMEKIERDLTNLEYDLNLIPNQREDIKKSYLNRMPDKFKEVEMAIPEAKTKAAEKGITQHPSFERAEKRLMENKGRFEEMKKQADQAAQTAAAKASEVETDVDALFKVYEPLKNNVFPKAPGSVIYYNDLNPVKECLGVIENFEKNDMNKVKKAYDDFSAKYGSTKEDVDAKMKELGYAGSRQPGYIYQELKEGIGNIAKTRTVMAEDLVTKINERITDLPSKHDFYRIQMHHEIKEWLTMAEKFDSQNTKVKEARASIDAQLAEDIKKFHKKIDDRKWQGNSSGREAKAALKYFEESPDWGKRATEPRHPLGVAITNEWSVQETDITNRPVMYGLPALIAVQVDSEKTDNLARVFNVTMRTQKSADAKKEPPFESITVGDSYYICADKIK